MRWILRCANCLRFCVLALLAGPLFAADTDAQVLREEVTFAPVGQPATPGQKLPKEVRATLSVPSGVQPPYPVVVILHGSSGIDGRGAFYAEALNKANIATFEIEMFRRLRPKLLDDTWPHLFGSLKYLSDRQDIDADRIGVMGFSWGGLLSLQAVNKDLTASFMNGDVHFAANAPIYPVCYLLAPGGRYAHLMEGQWTGAPVLVQAAGTDSYDDDGGQACRDIEAGLSEANKATFDLIIYPDATHKWDSRGVQESFSDEVSHKGAGGMVRIVPDEALAEASRQATTNFFIRAFGLK